MGGRDVTALHRGMGLQDVVALGISAAIGVSIFSVVGPATHLAGPGMLIALALAAIPMVIFAVVYAFLSSADPQTGASFYWPARYVHPYAGFMVCWLRILGSAGALNVMATIFADYLQAIAPVPPSVTVPLVLTAFLVLNLLDVSVAGGVARILTAMKLLVLAAFIGFGLMYVEARNFVPVAPHGVLGVLTTLPLLMGLFSGIESATEAGEEVRDPRRAIRIGLTVATIISVIVYLGVSVVSIGVLGADETAASRAPLADAAARFAGPWTGPAIAGLALISIGAAVNAQFLIFARFLLAMARDGVLPLALTRVNPRNGAPWVAVTTVYGMAMISLLMPNSLVFLFLAANVPTMLKYMSNCAAAIGLVRRRPDLHAAADLRMSARSVGNWAIAGILASGVMLVAGAIADWRAYALLGGWAVLGQLYWMASKHRRERVALAAVNA